MTINAPTVRTLLGFAISTHAAAARCEAAWYVAELDNNSGEMTEFSLDRAMWEESFTASQRAQTIEEPVFTVLPA